MDAAWVGRMIGEVEEDAFTRKSAGLDAASARKIDRRRDPDAPPIDEADRDAARALKGEKKKKKRKKSIPWHQRKWVKAAAMIAMLLGMMVGVYFAFIKSESPEKMYAAIEAARTPDEKLDAATKYLKTHGGTPNEKTDAAAAAFREGKVREREKVLANRFGAKMTKPDEADDKEAYDYAWHAMQAERDGRLKDAADAWAKVKARFAEEAKIPYTLDDAVLVKARWGWVADKRIRDLQSVEALAKQVADKVDEKRRFEVPIVYDQMNPESVAMRAVRLERFGGSGDWEKAGREWEKLASLTEKEPEQRIWYLLACERKEQAAKKTGDNALATRLTLIRNLLGPAEAQAKDLRNDPEKKADRAAVRIQCRDLAELYDDESDKQIGEAVSRARQIVADLPKT